MAATCTDPVLQIQGQPAACRAPGPNETKDPSLARGYARGDQKETEHCSLRVE